MQRPFPAGTAMSKLCIKAYALADYDESSYIGQIYLSINPSSFDISYKVKSTEELSTAASSADGKAQAAKEVLGNSPEYMIPEIKFSNILVDATGAYHQGSQQDKALLQNKDNKPSVAPYIKALKALIYDYHDWANGPAYLKLEWGEILPSNDSRKDASAHTFNCIISSMDINYSLFSFEGLPIRAELSLSFWGRSPFRQQQNWDQSAVRQELVKYEYHDIQQGDNLGKISMRYFGSLALYLLLAQYNGLSSLYELPVGRRLLIPPKRVLLNWAKSRRQKRRLGRKLRKTARDMAKERLRREMAAAMRRVNRRIL